MLISSNLKILVSVIIANHNGEKFLKKCIDSLLLEKSSRFEIIIVDDASTDNSINLIRKNYQGIKRLNLISLPENVGAARVRNIGIENALGKYLFFLDNDTVVNPGWASTIDNFFKKYPKTGIAQAKLLKMGTNNFDYAGDHISKMGFLIERARGCLDNERYNQEDKVFGVKSAAMIARKKVVDSLGGFDDDYFIYWEDTDICWRSWLSGFEVRMCPKITVWHAYGTENKDLKIPLDNKVTYRGCRNNIISLVKNLEISTLIFTLPINFFSWLTLSFMFALKGNFLKSIEIIRALGWITTHPLFLARKRALVQENRKISDNDLFSMVGEKINLNYCLGKCNAYLKGKPF